MSPGRPAGRLRARDPRLIDARAIANAYSIDRLGVNAALDTPRRATARCDERLGGGRDLTIQTPAIRSTTPVRGVAVPLPTRREGPAKLTGQALYADDLVFPGAWYGATIRSTVPHARLVAIELDPTFDWTRVAVVTSEDIPGRNVVASIAEDQPILVPAGGEIRHQAEPVALLAAADRDTLREAKRRVTLRTEALEPVFEPLESTTVFAHHELHQGRRGCRAGRGRPGDRRGDLPRRPPGAAVHREQRDDRVCRARTAGSPSTAASNARTTCTRRCGPGSTSTTPTRRWSRRRPAAASAGRRSTRR